MSKSLIDSGMRAHCFWPSWWSRFVISIVNIFKGGAEQLNRMVLDLAPSVPRSNNIGMAERVSVSSA